MLIGSYLGILSDSRRTAVPKKLLLELGDKPIIAKWYEDCLIMVSGGFWGEMSMRLTGGRNTLDIGLRDVERFILGSAYELEPDEQGRVIIPEVLVNFAKLEKEIVFIGLIDRIEVWPRNLWEEKAKEISKTTKEYIEKINQ